MKSAKPITILIADDDADDRLLAEHALQEAQLLNNLVSVEDGEKLLNYLQHKEEYSDSDRFPLPGIILLDLNMPKVDGREALKAIKSNEELKHIPVIVLTTSKAEEDIISTYKLGVNAYIRKPVSFEDLVDVMKELKKFWIEIVELPPSSKEI